MLKNLFHPQILIKVGTSEWVFISKDKTVSVPAYVYLKDNKILSVGEKGALGERVEIFSSGIDGNKRIQLMQVLFLFGIRKVVGRGLVIVSNLKIEDSSKLHAILEGKENLILKRLARKSGFGVFSIGVS